MSQNMDRISGVSIPSILHGTLRSENHPGNKINQYITLGNRANMRHHK